MDSGFRRNDGGIVVPAKAGTQAFQRALQLLYGEEAIDSGFGRNDGGIVVPAKAGTQAFPLHPQA